ncbi:MAG: MbnP family protein [Chitinophagales bacterium]
MVAVFANLCFYSPKEKKPDKPFTSHIFLQFNTVVGPRQFFLGSTYINSFGESFSISKFKYYVSNIEFGNPVSGAKEFIPGSYYLINESDSVSRKISIDITGSSYTTVSFLLGVDSLKNVSGAQGGALDPVNDMFWTWNTGYVMAKLEGNSPFSRQIHHAIEYHVGGFKGENSVLQKIDLVIPAENSLPVKRNLKMIIDVDLIQWFKGMHDLPISGNAACTSPGQLAKQFSENYRAMFKVQSVTSEE